MLYIVEQSDITNAKYAVSNVVGKTLATEDLQDLVGKSLILQVGTRGRGSKYVLE